MLHIASYKRGEDINIPIDNRTTELVFASASKFLPQESTKLQ